MRTLVRNSSYNLGATFTGFVNLSGSGFGDLVVRPNGVFVANGVAYSDWDSTTNTNRDQAIVYDENGIRRELESGGGTAASYLAGGAIWACSWGAWCVYDGAAETISTAHMGTAMSAQTIIGQDTSGNLYLLFVEGQTGVFGPTPQQSPSIAIALGLDRAFILDGGGSCQCYADNYYMMPSSDNSYGDERHLPFCLGVNAELSSYDTGWLSQPLATGFTERGGTGVRFRQVNSQVFMEIDVSGSFTTSSFTNILANQRPLRYLPGNGNAVGRGFLLGPGGSPATWFFGAGITVAAYGSNINNGYVAGNASWSAKHAAND